MSAPRRRKAPARPTHHHRAAAQHDFWGREQTGEDRAVVIRPSEDPTAMIRSLGPPPLPGRETIAAHYFEAVYDKAAALAVALAAASGLLETGERDDES
jgi:hypothetical protein